MIKFLFLIFLIFVFLVFLFGFSVLRGIFRLLFGGGQARNVNTGTKQEQRASYQAPKKRDKVFSKGEGEYVDYEEVKD